MRFFNLLPSSGASGAYAYGAPGSIQYQVGVLVLANSGRNQFVQEVARLVVAILHVFEHVGDRLEFAMLLSPD